MEIKKPNLQDVIEAIKVQIYEPKDRANLVFTYEGRKVEFEDEIWYEITGFDGASHTGWWTILDGNVVMYDGDRIALEDRVPEIDAFISADDE